MDPEHGASNSKGAGVRNRLHHSRMVYHEQSFILGFPVTNNEAKYEAVIVGLRMATTLGVTGLEICCDSTLVVCQVNANMQLRMNSCRHIYNSSSL